MFGWQSVSLRDTRPEAFGHVFVLCLLEAFSAIGMVFEHDFPVVIVESFCIVKKH